MFDLSVIIVSYNTIALTTKALDHLFSSIHDVKTKIYVVDNNSKDHSAEILRHRFPEITIIENSVNVGFGRANNQVLPYIDSRYLLLLNSDAFVEPTTLSKTVQYMNMNPRCGILGVKCLGSNGELEPSCRYFPTPWNIFLGQTGLSRIFKHTKLVDDMSWDHASVRSCDWVPGCYYLIRKELIDQIGLFDSRFFLYYEEVDHCYAAKAAGWHVTYFPYTSVVHLGGESAKSDGEITSSGRQLEPLQLESEFLYFRKNYGFVSVIIDLWLISIADCIQILKDIIRRRSKISLLNHLNHTLLAWKVFFHTRMGGQPTR